MALTYTTYEDNNSSGLLGGDVTTASRSYAAGELVVVLWVVERETPGDGTVSISNSGTAQSWNNLATVYTSSFCYVRGWWCVMSTTQAMTISCASTAGVYAAGVAYTLVHAGQHATTPVPAGKIYSGTDADGDVSQSITPTASGSCLWLVTGDWYNGTDTYAPATDCTKHDSYAVAGAFAAGLFRPTTQPRTDANAFTLGETDTSGKISWIAFEVQAAAASEVPTGTSGGRVTGSPTSFTGEAFTGSIEAGGQQIATGMASETDSSLSLARLKTKTYSFAAETDSALALNRVIFRATGMAEETDSAQPLAIQNIRYIGLAESANSAFSLAKTKIKSIDFASETDTAFALTRIEGIATGFAVETDSAFGFAITKIKGYTPCIESDTALALTIDSINWGLRPPLMFSWGDAGGTFIGMATETDAAFSLGIVKYYAYSPAAETDSALELARTKVHSAGIAEEIDSSLALARTKLYPVGVSNETDTAFALDIPFTGNYGIAVEVDTALGLTRTKIKSVGLASDVSTALALAKTKARSAGIANETDAALALAKTKIRPVGISTDTSVALALAKSKFRTFTPCVETDTSYALGRIKFKSVGLAESANIALAPSVGLGSANPGLYFPWRYYSGGNFASIAVSPAIETDTAYSLTRVKFKSVGFATETDIALPLGTGMPGFRIPFRFLAGDPAGAQYIVTGRADSTNTALALGLIRQPTILMVRWAQETPVASSLAKRKIRAYGVAISANTAIAPSIGRRYAVGVAESSNLAIAPTFGIVRGIGIAVEVDSAHSLVYRKLISTKIAESLNEALAMVAPQIVAIGIAIETDSAFALTPSSTYGIGLASETDSAFALRPSRLRSTGVANEVDSAFALNRGLVTSTKLAQSFNTSFALTAKKVKTYGIATSTNTARAPMLLAMTAQERDVACFLEVKRNGVVVYPPQIPHRQRRIWASTFS